MKQNRYKLIIILWMVVLLSSSIFIKNVYTNLFVISVAFICLLGLMSYVASHENQTEQDFIKRLYAFFGK